MRRSLLLVPLLLLPVACSDGDDASDQVVGSGSGSASVDEATSTTDEADPTTSEATTTTVEPFAGQTTPTSIASSATAVALLTDVTVEPTSVTFTFRDQVPGIDAGYVETVTADGSGEPVEVAGDANLQIRMEPASGVDLSSSSGSFEETYTGPDRIEGSGQVVEVVRTGDFEANLTWVIGVANERTYRVDVEGSTVVVSVSP